jgi:hypothetical protein
MADFAGVVRHWMAERGMSLRGLAAAAHYDPGLLSKVLNGRRPYSPYLAARLDRALGAGGEIENAALDPPPAPSGRRAPHRKQSKAIEALQVAMAGDTDDLDIAEDGLSELVHHYAHAVATVPSAAVYDELLSARSFAGTLLGRARPPLGRPDLIVATGWLSSLLAISAADMGDHAAALVWCSDTERRGRDARYPELLGWAAITRALIAYYQGDPSLSAAAARRGQADALAGTVACAKLASQEMRCLAMLGDAAGMADARHRAAVAMDQLSPSAATSGIYSLPRADDPPYTATSLLLTGKYQEAAETTRHLIDTAYSPRSRAPGDQPTNYARTLLILALAAAGLGDIDEAAAAGGAALECGRVVWPTMVLAGKLDQSLARTSPGAAYAADFHARYIDAGQRLALPAGRQERP